MGGPERPWASLNRLALIFGKGIMSRRNDVRDEGKAPKDVQSFLRKIGGRTPFGENQYRLVLAQHVLVYEGGEWCDYPDEAPISERGGLDYQMSDSGLYLAGADAHKPERVVCEMRWTERYPPEAQGWTLQKWYPCDYYPKEEWENIKLKDHADLAVLGPYPTEGNYEQCTVWQEDLGAGLILSDPQMSKYGMISKYVKEIPPLRALEKAVICFENRPAPTDLAATREQRIKIRVAEWMFNEERRREKRREMKRQIMKDHMSPYWGNSLEAGRLREVLAKRAGIKSHVGA